MGSGLVKVQTWGTFPGSASGLINFLLSWYRDENPGHVALEMRLPVNQANQALIEKYCTKDPKIPFEEKTYVKVDGTKGKEYVVRFSFLPGRLWGRGRGAYLHLNPSYKEDTIYERSGLDTTDRHYLELSELTVRRSRNRVINLFPACSLTEKGRSVDFSTPKGQYILKLKEIANYKDLQETAELIEEKTSVLKPSKTGIDLHHPSNKTILIAAKRLDIVLPKGKISEEKLAGIIFNISKVKGNIAIKLAQLAAEETTLKSQVVQTTEDSTIFFSSIDDYLCYGRPADGEIQLPLGTGKNELNASAMLEQMRKIIDSGLDYDLYTHNCSSTALSILQAGKKGIVSKISPTKGLTTINPQTVYNKAIALREIVCKVSASHSLSNLDKFYASNAVGIKVIPRESANLHEAILRFAVDNLFPEAEDLMNKTFYVFSKRDVDSILKQKGKLIPTELLRDLWGIVPDRTLPLSKDGSNNVVIDRNMTLGQLIHGLSILAQNNSESRLNIQKGALIESKEKDPYKILKEKIESEIMRLGKKTDPKSVKKTTNLIHAYINTVEKINSIDPPISSKEKCVKLFNELTPLLKVNTGFGFREATSYKEVKKTTIELGVYEKTSKATQSKMTFFHPMKKESQEKQEAPAVTKK